MKFEIKNRWTGSVQIEAEIECAEDAPLCLKVGLSVLWALGGNADLSNANLSNADLSNADLSGADLSNAILSGADLSGADLSGADLSGAVLSGADLSNAILSGADLSGAVLSGADLRDAILSGHPLVGARPFLQIGPIGSRSDHLLVWRTEDGVYVQTGCFYGSLDAFQMAVERKSEGCPYRREYQAAIGMIHAHADIWTPTKEARNAE